MDEQNGRTAVSVCDGLAAKTGDAALGASARLLHKALEQEHKPTMALVSFNMNHAERFEIIKNFGGAAVPEELTARVKGEPACIIFDYSKKPVMLREGADGILTYGLPCDVLKAHRIAVCDEIKAKEKWLALSDEIDVACLLVNATMAMNQVERTWLHDCGIPLFRENQPVIAVVGTQLLNSEEDVQAVNQAVDAALRRLELNTQVYADPVEALRAMDAFLSGPQIAESHARRVTLNCLTEAEARAKGILEGTAGQAAAVDAAVTKLEEQRNTLEMAAQLASESILFNELSRLKVMATESIRAYGRQMADDIKYKVETYPTDQLSGIDETLYGYAAEGWNVCIQSVTATTDKELARVQQQLIEQMERDAGALISRLDEPTRRTVYNAVNFGAPNAPINAAGMAMRAPAEFSGLNVNDITHSLRKETRNMMLLSIPILFVNPLLAVGNVIVSGVIGKYRTDSELKTARADIAKQIEMMCVENAEAIVRYTQDGFDRQMQEGAQNIRAAYDGLLTQLEGDLRRMKAQQGQNAAVNGYLAEQVQSVIPELLRQL